MDNGSTGYVLAANVAAWAALAAYALWLFLRHGALNKRLAQLEMLRGKR